MGDGERTPMVSAADEATVLRYEPSRREILLGIDWPPILYFAIILHLMLAGLGLSTGVSALAALAMSFLFAAAIARLVSGTTLLTVDDETIVIQGLWKKEIALDGIGRVTLQARWGPARVVLLRRGAPDAGRPPADRGGDPRGAPAADRGGTRWRPGW